MLLMANKAICFWNVKLGNLLLDTEGMDIDNRLLEHPQ